MQRITYAIASSVLFSHVREFLSALCAVLLHLQLGDSISLSPLLVNTLNKDGAHAAQKTCLVHGRAPLDALSGRPLECLSPGEYRKPPPMSMPAAYRLHILDQLGLQREELGPTDAIKFPKFPTNEQTSRMEVLYLARALDCLVQDHADLLHRFRSLSSCTGHGVADTFEVLHREIVDVTLAELVRQVSPFLALVLCGLVFSSRQHVGLVVCCTPASRSWPSVWSGVTSWSCFVAWFRMLLGPWSSTLEM